MNPGASRNEIESNLHALVKDAFGARAESPEVRAYMRDEIAKARARLDAEYESLAAKVRATDPTLSKAAAGAKALTTDRGIELYENLAALDGLSAHFA
jgi:hypothetical protein